MLGAVPYRGTKQNSIRHGNTLLCVGRHLRGDAVALAQDEHLAAAVVGTIDDQAQLAEDIRRAGGRGPGHNAADTLISAFRVWGSEAPVRLRGSFAGVVSDGTRLWCFRDHLGSQTFFYRDHESYFLGASEPKQVLAGARLQREPDTDGVTDIFYYRLDRSQTALRGIARLPNATIAEVGPERGVTPRRYWDPSDLLESASISPADARERLAELLDQAVTRALSGADAISLSGGLDSPTIAAFAAPRHLELGGRPLTAISTVFPDYPNVDESHYIQLVAAQLPLELHTFVQQSSPLDDLSSWVDALDGPWDTLPIQEAAETYEVARRFGARRILTGEMAEAVAVMGGPLFAHLVSHGRLRPAARWLRIRRRSGWNGLRIAREIGLSVVPSAMARRYAALRRDHYRALQVQSIPDWVDTNEWPDAGAKPELEEPIRNRWRRAQLLSLGSIGSAVEADYLCAPRYGLQVRMPFADVDLWEFFLSLPAEVKFPDLNNVSKRLIRDTVRGRLPDEIVDRRRKTYFDDHILGTVDYAALKRYVLGTEFRMQGVDYSRLGEAIDRREMSLGDVVVAYDLARAHAFMGLWE
jgi:asparagine synthase (glutamine-hydrolysing)